MHALGHATPKRRRRRRKAFKYSSTKQLKISKMVCPLCRILENDIKGTTHMFNFDRKGEEDTLIFKSLEMISFERVSDIMQSHQTVKGKMSCNHQERFDFYCPFNIFLINVIHIVESW